MVQRKRRIAPPLVRPTARGMQARRALPAPMQRRAIAARQGKPGIRTRIAAALRARAAVPIQRRPGGGNVRMKPTWARTGWAALPIIGPLFDILRNLLFRKESARAVKRQRVGILAKKTRPPLQPEKPISPGDRLAQARGNTERFAVKRAVTERSAARGKRKEAA